MDGLDTAFTASAQRLDEDWHIVQNLLPEGWQAKARELGAMQRSRGFSDPGVLLRVLLIHLGQGCSLRETVVRASEGGLIQVSDVAILKRLRGCGEWFKWMADGLRQIRAGFTTVEDVARVAQEG